MRRSLVNAGQELFKNAFDFLQRAAKVWEPEAGSRITLPVLEALPLAIPATAALVYNHGREKAEGRQGENGWLKHIGFSTINQWLIQTTNLYPLVNLALGWYQAAQKNTLFQQIKVMVQTLSVIITGWLGVNILGVGLTEAFKRREETLMRGVLKGTSHTVEQVAEKMSSATQTEAVQEFGKRFKALFNALDALGEARNKSWTQYVEVRHALDQCKLDLFEQFGKVGWDDFLRLFPVNETVAADMKQAEKTVAHRLASQAPNVTSLRNLIFHSQNPIVQMTRWLNPSFGFIVAAALLGIPLARAVSGLIGKTFPHLKGQPAEKILPKEAYLSFETGKPQAATDAFWEPPAAQVWVPGVGQL